ncbi:MAG TPA: NeuD/PglB/VioB family sugar acetyltransferase [Burkholderiaceae bacterium]|jgi:sugar O-acyltransferase (sialic acid O-acetyltransferase NeuD family)
MNEPAAAPPKGLLILGFGGHARVVADIAIATGIIEFCFVDPNARAGENFLGHPVLAAWNATLPEGWQAFSAAGDNILRQDHCELIKSRSWPLASLLASSATIGAGAMIMEGCLVGQHAHVGPMASIGTGCIINTGAIVEHESSVGEFSHISVHSTVAGRSRVGRFAIIGAGATVIDGIEIGDSVIVGAGAVVHRSITAPGTYVGVPVRRLD